MRIALNISSALKPRPTGIARYIEQLVPALLEERIASDHSHEFVLGVRPHRWSSRKHSALVRGRSSKLRLLTRPYRFLTGPVDVLHSLGAWIPERPVPFRTILTVHDLHTIDRPELVEPRRAQRRAEKLRRGVAAADAIMTPSEFTRERVIDHFAVEPDCVFSVPHGVDHRWAASTTACDPAPVVDRPYILGPGDTPRRKRGDLLIEAWSRSQVCDDFDLVLFGGRGPRCSILSESRARVRNPERVHLLDYVPDEALVSLFRNAHAFVFPSEYEGFGLPVLEALSVGCPVVVSDHDALVEITGGEASTKSEAALRFPVGDTEACTRAIDRVVCDSALRERLVRAGTRWASAHSWRAAARRTLEIYEAVAGG